MGGAGKAYYDVDTKNQGGEYREDRVDIVKNGDGFAVGYTQKGEWLEYTVNVQAGGKLPFELSYASGMDNTGVRLLMDDEPITDTLALTDLKAGLKTAGFGSGVYVVRNPAGKTLKLQTRE